MKNKINLLFCLIILLTCIIYFAFQAKQKNGSHRANFSGEWQSKESISMGGNIVCSYVEGDRMLSKKLKIAQRADFLTIEIPNYEGDRMLAKSMKIAEQANFITKEIPNLYPDSALAKSQEKLTFDGKESQINYGRERVKKFTAKLSADGQTMTVKSIVHLMVPTPYHVDVLKQAFCYVTEVWTLSNDGKSISVQANAKSNLFGEERSWNTVFDKVR